MASGRGGVDELSSDVRLFFLFCFLANDVVKPQRLRSAPSERERATTRRCRRRRPVRRRSCATINSKPVRLCLGCVCEK